MSRPSHERQLKPGQRLELKSLRTGRAVECEIDKPLGTGGTAEVYAGRLDDGGQIVLKTPRGSGPPDPGFELEVELFKKLFHRNIVHCVGAGQTPSGAPVIGFRRAYQNPLLLMAKASVREGLRRDKTARYPSLSLDTALDFGYELLNALDYLERLGIVHHDVKLANVLVDVAPRERPLEGPEVFGAVVRRAYRGVLIDFGAARSRSYLEAWNRGEAPSGLAPQITPVYAPPESLVERRQVDGKLRVTFHPSLDVYAAALVFYALVTGHPPYSHLKRELDWNDLESVIGVKSAERRGELIPISTDVIRRTVFSDTRFAQGNRASFDQAFHRFLMQRLDPDPEARGTAADMKRELEKLAAIKNTRNEGPRALEQGRKQVFLPFQQELVQVGKGGEHPLLEAARLYGIDTGQVVAPSELGKLERFGDRRVRQTPSGTGSESSLDWLEEFGDGEEGQEAPSSSSSDSSRVAHRETPFQGRDGDRLPDRLPERPRRSTQRFGGELGRQSSRDSDDGSTLQRAAGSDRNRRRPGERPSSSRARTRTPDSQQGDGTHSGETPLPSLRAQADPYGRGRPPQEASDAPHVLVSPVIGDPVLLSRSREYVIGRDSAAAVRIKSDLVSRRHATVFWDGEVFRVRDMGSLNGTQVNGHRVGEPCPLFPDDRITLGGFDVYVRVLSDDASFPEEGEGGTTRILSSAKELLRQAAGASFAGNLHELQLREVIELIQVKRQSGTLQVKPSSGDVGRIYLVEGQIVHAEDMTRRSGLEAALKLLRIRDGRFVFAKGDPACPRSIEPDNDRLWQTVAQQESV